MELITRYCIECNNPFIVENETDALCDICANKNYTPRHRTDKELKGRDWESKKVREKWNEAARKSREKCMKNVDGVNYRNPK